MEINDLEHNNAYKYSGMNEANSIRHTINKEKKKKTILWENKSYIKSRN